MGDMISGILVVSCMLTGIFFFRFYAKTRDRFFLFFGLAFSVFGFNWVGLAVTGIENELRTYFYLLRLAAFVLIIAAILDKNRGRAPERETSTREGSVPPAGLRATHR